MHFQTYNTYAPKKATNVSINDDLLRKAKELKINLSQTLEQRLVELLCGALAAEWQQQNKTAIQHYNQRIHEKGAFSDGLRQF